MAKDLKTLKVFLTKAIIMVLSVTVIFVNTLTRCTAYALFSHNILYYLNAHHIHYSTCQFLLAISKLFLCTDVK